MLPVEEAIVEKLWKAGPCCFNEVVTSLPNFSWGQIFVAVHRMSQDGRVFLGKVYATYQISLSSRHTELNSVTSESAVIDRAEAVMTRAGVEGEVARRQGSSSVASV